MKWKIFKPGTFFFLSLLSIYGTAIGQVSNTLPWTFMKGDSTLNNNGIYGSIGIAASGNKPGGREGCGLNWTDASGNLWMFGDNGLPASGSSVNLNDLWKYNPISNQWTWVNGDNTGNTAATYGTQGIATALNNPGNRHLSTTWSDNAGNLWLFAGYNAAGVLLNDLWKYNIASNQWTWMSGDNTGSNIGHYNIRGVSTPLNKPGARSRACRPDSKVDGSGNLWLFGGNGYSSGSFGDLNDLWKYNIASNQWTWMSGDTTANGT